MAGGSPAAEPEALKYSFSYLVNSIDTAALLPAALSRNLITDRQRTECSNEADPYKKAETFVGYLQRAVNADYDNFHSFVQILEETGQAQIASFLCDERARSFRAMQQPLASSSTDEETAVIIVPTDALLKELADLRFAFAKLLNGYKNELQNSPETQEAFVEFVSQMFHSGSEIEDHSFQAHFTLVEKEVSLFNTHYLKQLYTIFSEDVRATTRQLVNEYEQQRQHFMASTTVSQFKQQLFQASASRVHIKLSGDHGREVVNSLTLDDLKNYLATVLEESCDVDFLSRKQHISVRLMIPSPSTPASDTAETDFAIVKEHIKQQGSVDMLSLKSYLIGPSGVGKTTTLRRLTGEITHSNSSTGIDAPLTVQLYHDTEQSSVLISEGWQTQGLSEQCQVLCSHILNSPTPPPLNNTSQPSLSSSIKLSSTDSQPSSIEQSTVSPSATQPKPIPPQDEIISELLSLVKIKDWENIREFLKNLKIFTLLHIVDIGGQPEFHEILPLLLHGLAINLIFFNMTKSLDSPYTVVYRDEDSGSSPIQYESEFTVREVIQRALSSISSLQSNTNYSQPAAILVGTHHDKCSEADILALEQSVKDTFVNFIKSSVLCPVSKPGEKKRYIHPVNNVSGDSSDIEGLRKLITTVVHSRFESEEVPTATMLLHLILRMRFDPTPGWCSLEECIKIAEDCGISREDLLNKDSGILRYLHDRFGTILHYQKIQEKEKDLKISQRVIVNPNIIMRPPVELVVTAFGAEGSEHEVAERIRFTGEIPHRLMEKACSPNKGLSSTDKKIPTDEIVELLKSRFILYENAQSADEEKVYFLPCLLSPDNYVDKESHDPSHLNNLTYPPILLIPNKGYVPLGPFPATVVKLSQSSHWRLAETEFSIQTAERSRFRNRIRFYFQLPQEKTLDVELRALSTHLELRIRHDASSKPVNRLIPECLRELRISFDEVLLSFPHTQDWKWDFGFYCPHTIQSGQRPHPARCGTKDKPQDVICSQRNCKNGPVDLEDKHKCWFTEVANQSLQVRDDHEEPSCKYKDPLTVKQLVKAVASVSDWFTLGLYLGLEIAELNDIRTTHHLAGVNMLKAMMFDKWLKRCLTASWDDVIDALIDLDEFTAADRVRAGRPQNSLPKTAACELSPKKHRP